MMSNDATTTPRRHARYLGCAILVVLASTLPAKAQVMDDFLCSTFSYKCHPPPPPPPPDLAPGTPPVAAEPTHVRHHKAHKGAHAAASKSSAPGASDAAPANADAK